MSYDHKQMGSGPRILNQNDLTYNSYLRIPELLKLQKRVSDPPEHDEMLFIIIHQAFELWFKQIIHELEAAREKMKSGLVLPAQHHLKRVSKILELFAPQIHILETMTPADFLRFRDRLNPASGFQSLQFREVEFMMGLKDERYLQFFQHQPDMLKALQARLAEDDLKAVFYELLRTVGHTGIPAQANEENPQHREAILADLKRVYERRESELPLYLLIESLLDIDQGLILFRQHHVQVVERLIGHKTGTGGSSGVDYLRKTTLKRCFPLLWEVRTLIEKV